MSCCGGNCSRGSSCNGCGMYPDLNVSETTTATTTHTIIAGVALVKTYYGGFEMSFEAENDDDSGNGCKCNPCNC